MINNDTHKHLQAVLFEGQRQGNRTNEILEFSQTTNQAFKHLDIKQVIAQAIAEVKPTLNNRNIRIDTDFDPQLIPILGDRDLLVQNFVEVMTNSINHLDFGGRIGIVCRCGTDRPGFVCINFIDNGPGIDIRIQPQVFDPAFAAKSGGTGTGISLASIKLSVEKYDGEMDVLANNGGGAHIRFLLPMVSTTTMAIF